jgi:hypothetical protein
MSHSGARNVRRRRVSDGGEESSSGPVIAADHKRKGRPKPPSSIVGPEPDHP